MANRSEAFGTITFKANSQETVQCLIKAFKTLEYGTYNTYLVENSEGDIEQNESQYTFTTSFNAAGRWTYKDNVGYSGQWLKQNLSNERIVRCTIGETDTEHIIDVLKNTDWTVNYDFTDKELWSKALYKAELETLHKAGDGIDKLVLNEISKRTYDCTLPNLFKLGFYDTIVEALEDFVLVDEDAATYEDVRELVDAVNDLAKANIGGSTFEEVLEQSSYYKEIYDKFVRQTDAIKKSANNYPPNELIREDEEIER